VAYVKRERPRLLCLSMVTLPTGESFIEKARLLWQITRETGTGLAFGGRGIPGGDEIPCDLNAGSLKALESFAGHLATRRTPRVTVS
jgi:hypothetical protein